MENYTCISALLTYCKDHLMKETHKCLLLILLLFFTHLNAQQPQHKGVKAKPLAKIEKSIDKLNSEISSSEKEEKSIISTYVATYKDNQGENTGDFFLVHQREGQSDDYVENQAKLIAGDRKYFLQKSPIQKGYCGILYQLLPSGEMMLKNKIRGGKKAAQKIYTRIENSNNQKALKLICN
ncbi:hypothetical protein [Maribacter sp. 2308TA10-17]|uniref:hypothetical protein n=1 Tax=Maribacter sp. 2308TA10-17 TaxID=3386276 RepID=UPI0039BD0562